MHIPRADKSREARAEWCRDAVAKTIVKYYRSDAGAAMWFGNNGERSRSGANYMIEEIIKGDLRVSLWIGYAHVDSQTRSNAGVAILEHAKRQDGERIKVAAQYYAEAAQQLSALFGY